MLQIGVAKPNCAVLHQTQKGGYKPTFQIVNYARIIDC